MRTASSAQPLCGYLVNFEPFKPRDERFDSFVGCAKLLLALASSLSILGWIYASFIVLTWSGFPKTLLQAFVLVYPFIYLSAAIFCCWFNIPRRALFITAALLNIPAVAIGIYSVRESFTVSIVCFLFTVLWALLCVARGYTDNTAA
jgi:hypothetical protein